jgi:hypothetical protein
MIALPNRPFTTADFSLKGGGVDFLGLRWVSLTIVGQHLVPELNNVTRDMGMFCLGAWIPWKFHQLCRGPADYRERKYQAFREKIEVALSMTFEERAQIRHRYGSVRRKLGTTQKCSEPQKLSFNAVHRNEQNSLFAAANYGPALQALGLIATYRSQAEKGKFVRIPIASDDPGTTKIVTAVDNALKQSKKYSLLASFDVPKVRWNEINSLGKVGLEPTVYRASAFRNLKRAFRVKLLPKEPEHPGYRRTLTARLVVATIRQAPNMTAWDVRHAWYTSYLKNGRELKLAPELVEQYLRWSGLIARQYQRYPFELFLWIFEEGLREGARSIDDLLSYWRKRSSQFRRISRTTVAQFLKELAGSCYRADELATSQQWNKEIDPDHARFEYVEDAQTDDAPYYALKMLGGWYWRAMRRLDDPKQAELMQLGGADRISMVWFIKWLQSRSSRELISVVRDILSDLIFAQHVRVALARFDGRSQRLRFALSDAGIEPTVSARKDLAQLDVTWMSDRLDSLIGLLCDCDVLAEDNGKLREGAAAADI